MVYKNLILRSIFSIIFISLYLVISQINLYYIYLIILSIYILIILEVYVNFKKYKFLPYLYIFLSFFFSMNIKLDEENFILFNLFIFIVISFDILSYLTGKLFGKHKLIKISPKKTVEGFLGGFLISFILSYFYIIIFEITFNLFIFLFILTILTSAFIGDIIESYFKRRNNIKNSSEFIPGHGGVFDRFDSFLFSIIFYSISSYFLL